MDEYTIVLSCIAGAGSLILFIKVFEYLYIYVYNTYRKIVHGKSDSTCEYCRNGVKLSNNFHIVVDNNGDSRFVLCKERIRQLIKKHCNGLNE